MPLSLFRTSLYIHYNGAIFIAALPVEERDHMLYVILRYVPILMYIVIERRVRGSIIRKLMEE